MFEVVGVVIERRLIELVLGVALDRVAGSPGSRLVPRRGVVERGTEERAGFVVLVQRFRVGRRRRSFFFLVNLGFHQPVLELDDHHGPVAVDHGEGYRHRVEVVAAPPPSGRRVVLVLDASPLASLVSLLSRRFSLAIAIDGC